MPKKKSAKGAAQRFAATATALGAREDLGLRGGRSSGALGAVLDPALQRDERGTAPACCGFARHLAAELLDRDDLAVGQLGEISEVVSDDLNHPIEAVLRHRLGVQLRSFEAQGRDRAPVGEALAGIEDGLRG